MRVGSFLILFCAAVAWPAHAQLGPERLAVVVETADDTPANDGLTAFSDAGLGGRADTAKDIVERLNFRERRHVRPARAGETPQVRVVVLRREYVNELYTIYARVDVGDTKRDVTSDDDDSWRDAALNFVKQLDAWVGENKQAIKAAGPPAK